MWVEVPLGSEVAGSFVWGGGYAKVKEIGC